MASDIYAFLSQKEWFPKTQERLEELKQNPAFKTYCAIGGINRDRFIEYASKQLGGNGDIEQMGQDVSGFEEMPIETLENVKAAYRDLCSNHSDLFNSSDAEELENTRGHLGLDSFCKSEHNVSLKDVINYAITQLGENGGEEQATDINNQTIPTQTYGGNSPLEHPNTSSRADELLRFDEARREEIYSQKLATPVFGGDRLSDEDGIEVIKYLFEHNFDAGSIAYLKEKLKSNNTIILDTPYIFELALLDILQTDKYEEHEDSITEDFRYASKTPKNKEFALKLDKLYGFITKERIEKERLDDEDIYLPAVNAIISTGFNSTKQDTLKEIYNELKTRDAISKTFEEFMKEKGNSKIRYLEFHPSVLIYHIVLKNRFEKTFTTAALNWYKNISGTEFSECFYESAIAPEKIETSVKSTLTDIYKLCLDGSGRSIRKTSGMEYIEYINTIKLAKDFLRNAGFKKESKNITGSVNAHKALNIIKQQKGKRKDGAREKFIDAIEFMKSECHSFPPKDTQNLLKEWYLQETKSKKGGKKSYRPYGRQFETKSLKSRISRLYREFGGEKKDIVVKTPAQIFEQQINAAEKRRQQKEADFKREMDWEAARREELRKRFEEPSTEYKRFKEEPGEEIKFTVYNVKLGKNKITLFGQAENGNSHKVVAPIKKSEFDVEPTRDELVGQRFIGIVTGHKGNHLNLINVEKSKTPQSVET